MQVYLSYCTLVVAVIVTALYGLIHILFVRTADTAAAAGRCVTASGASQEEQEEVEMSSSSVRMRILGKPQQQTFNPLNREEEEDLATATATSTATAKSRGASASEDTADIYDNLDDILERGGEGDGDGDGDGDEDIITSHQRRREEALW